MKFHFLDRENISTSANPDNTMQTNSRAFVHMLRAMFLGMAENWLAEHSQKARIGWQKARSEGRNAGRGKFIPAERKAAAIQSVKDGATYADVARSLDIPANTVRNWCKKAAVSSRHKTPSTPDLRDELAEVRIAKLEKAAPMAQEPARSHMKLLAAMLPNSRNLREAAGKCGLTYNQARSAVASASYHLQKAAQ